MPYIAPALREPFRNPIDQLIVAVQELEDNKQDGALNYIISELVTKTMRPFTGWNYYSIHRAHGIFQDAGAEFYRRVAGPYEDQCIERNGDLYGYKL